MHQRSPEWFAVKCGVVSASRVADIIAKTKSGYSSSRANYMAQLVCERATGTVEPSFTNAAMEWGTEKEPLAREAYSVKTGNLVTEVGFIRHPYLEAGASPDGMVGSNLIEIKCPNTATHIDTLLSQTVPTKYITQMQWQMACTGALWCDYVSYDPRMEPRLQLFVKRVDRDGEYIKELEGEVSAFLAELELKIKALQEINNGI